MPRAKGCAVFADDIDEARDLITEAMTRTSSPTTAITLEWHGLPPLADELDRAVRSLADAAVTIYPRLYAQENAKAPEIPGVIASVARRILAACQEKRRPRLRHLPLAEQIRQLALALDPHLLALVIVVRADRGSDGALLSFARGAEWLAVNAAAKVVLVLPTALDRHASLDAFTYRSRRLARTHGQAPDIASVVSPIVEPRGAGPLVSVATLQGKPHPASEPEQRLHGRICADAELGALFRYNQLVEIEFGATPRVDLIWPEGRLVVEVDGYALHSRKHQFHADRERDYRLLMSGYRVWRIADAEIDVDAERVVEKLRKLVRMLRKDLR